MKDIYVPFQPALLSSGLKSLGLSMRECRPSNVLSSIVHSYVSMDVEKPVHYPIMPDGTVSIFVFPGETLIRGPFSHPINPYIDAAGNYFGIRFYPAGLRFLFRNNFEEISHQVVDSRFFECKVFDSIHQRIYDSNSWQEQISIM